MQSYTREREGGRGREGRLGIGIFLLTLFMERSIKCWNDDETTRATSVESFVVNNV